MFHRLPKKPRPKSKSLPFIDREWEQAPAVGREFGAPLSSEPKIMRYQLYLKQAEFARQFGIPLTLLRAWELGTKRPDAVHRAYLKVIAADPDYVQKVLGRIGIGV